MKLFERFRRKARTEESRELHAPEGGKRDDEVSSFFLGVPSGEFRTLEEMLPSERKFEMLQKWSLVKSDSGWWVCRNDAPFLGVKTLQEGKDYLHKYSIEIKDIDDRQRELTADDFRGMRETRARMYESGSK